MIVDRTLEDTRDLAISLTLISYQPINPLHLFSGTFNGRWEKKSFLWQASFEVNLAEDIVLQNNSAAGSEKIGFHLDGENCYQTTPGTSWHGNVAHTTLHGVHIGYTDGLPGCSKVSRFTVWKSWDYGVYAYTASSVIVSETVIADSKIGTCGSVALRCILFTCKPPDQRREKRIEFWYLCFLKGERPVSNTATNSSCFLNHYTTVCEPVNVVILLEGR